MEAAARAAQIHARITALPRGYDSVIGEDARLGMVLHECLESRFARAVEALNELGELRGPARSIHVIEERS